jgi:prolyl-tRNA synthetase
MGTTNLFFLRTSEFLWQEGHCAHTTDEENQAMVDWALNLYKKTYHDLLAIYGVTGVKSDSENLPAPVKLILLKL